MQFVGGGGECLACLVCNSEKVQEKCNCIKVVGDGGLNRDNLAQV